MHKRVVVGVSTEGLLPDRGRQVSPEGTGLQIVQQCLALLQRDVAVKLGFPKADLGTVRQKVPGTEAAAPAEPKLSKKRLRAIPRFTKLEGDFQVRCLRFHWKEAEI